MKQLSQKNNNSRPIDFVVDLLMYLILGAFSLLCVFPIYYVFIYSISDPVLAGTGITFLPKGFSMSSYAAIFKLDSLSTAFIVSIARTILGTMLTVVCCGFFGYLMTQQDMPARKFIYRFTVITMYVGGGLIPTYLLMKNINMLNTFWIYIIPGALGAYNVILIKTFIENIPKSLEESAMIDGAGYLTIFFKIIFPVSLPILATIAIFSAVGQWSSWFDNMLYVSNPKLYTAQYVLYMYLNEADAMAKQLREQRTNMNSITNTQMTPESIKMAITMVVMLPILCVYPYMQKYFIKGIMVGAIKG
jgi:putative aldouronate transport system permease protein